MVLTDVLYQVMKAFVRKSRDAKSQPPASFKYPSAAGHSIRDGTLWLSKIGDIPMVPPYPETQAYECEDRENGGRLVRDPRGRGSIRTS